SCCLSSEAAGSLAEPPTSACRLPSPLLQRPNDRRIGGQEADLEQLVDGYPLERLPLEAARLARVARHEPHVEPHPLLGIGVRELDQRRRIEHVDAELLGQLALERGAAAFAARPLAAGK